MTVDGKGIAEEAYRALEARVARAGRPVALGILVCGADAVIESFVRIKTRAALRLGVAIERVDIPETADAAVLIDAVRALAARTDALVVQLPLPHGIDTDSVLAAIPKESDVDALNPRIPEAERPVSAPVALAVLEILRAHDIDPSGKRVVVIGNGRLVGAPVAALLRNAGAAVSQVTLEAGSLAELKDADIIVSGAGRPGLITPDMLAPGVALIDAGTSEHGGVISGDADPACAEVAGLFTPVPGGVGPVAVAMLFRNLLDLAEKGQ